MKHIQIALLILWYFSPCHTKAYSQNVDLDTLDLHSWIDAQFIAALDSFNIAGATIVLMHGDSIMHLNGYGLADIESNTPVNAYSSIFGIASISKTFVATAIMQLYEDGKLEPDRDVNSYLKTFQLDYKFNDSITVRHLLTHTAGFDDRNIGSSVRTEDNVIPLAQYLKKRMPPQIRPSGKVISYTNQAYGLLGLIVEEVSGMPCNEYIRQRILKPLEMDYSGFKRQPELKKNFASSYLQKGSQLIPYKPEFRLDYPASSCSSTASDMGHYISMFMNHGNYKGIQILDSTTVVKMFQTAFKPYEKSDRGWLLGFTESQWNGIRLVRHTGELQGFASELVLIPENNLGLFISVNSSSMPNSNSLLFIYKFVNSLLSRLIPDSIAEKEKSKGTPKVSTVDEPLEMFTGRYRLTRYAHKTLDKLAVLTGFVPEIGVVANDNKLEVPEWQDKLTPFSDLTFHSIYDRYLAFDRNTKGEISYFFADTFSYQKLKWYEPVTFQIFWIGSIILVSLIFIFTSVIGKLFVRNRKKHIMKRINFLLAALILIFLALVAYVLLETDPQEFFYGIPLLIKIALVIPFIIIPLEVFAIYSLTKAIRMKQLGTLSLIYQSVIVVAALFFIPWLMYYNLIGFNY